MSDFLFTDAHCHVTHSDCSRCIVCSPFDQDCFVREKREGSDVFFIGVHPWDFKQWESGVELRERLSRDNHLGVGEIGLDRLRDRCIPDAMRRAFREQLEIAAEFKRPVVLHGAKCWGEVFSECKMFASQIPAFLFHGFSRSGGLIPSICEINGFISVGPAVLNNHAVNYRKLVTEIPIDRILVESDVTDANVSEIPRVCEIAGKVAELRNVELKDFHETLKSNVSEFLSALNLV